MLDQHELSAFSEVLNSAEKPILVGGQAVNLWAEHYGSAIPSLDPLRPFMSKDADMLHAGSRLALTQFLNASDRGRSVVISHHAPSIRSLQIGKETDLISAAYASNLEAGARSLVLCLTALG